MVNPWQSSLLYPILEKKPYSDWMKLITNETDFQLFIKSIAGIPKPWIEWVETTVKKSIDRRGDIIEKPLAYRIAVLWNGMILLQETKFICDVFENSLRQAVFSYATEKNLRNGDIRTSIPDHKKLFIKLGKNDQSNSEDSTPVSELLLLNCTFYQLTEIIRRNWKKVSSCKTKHKGFTALFWKEQKCRDVNVFSKDMKKIRLTRNEIAHSKKLFHKDETQAIYEIACKWLLPLDVQLKNKILTYRNDRPKFLEQLLLR